MINLERGRPITFVLDSNCLLSDASEPHRLPACPFKNGIGLVVNAF